MTARLNGVIKMTNLLVNQFTLWDSAGKVNIETLHVGASPSFPVSEFFSKFNHFFADSFFRYKKRKNTFKNGIKLKIGYSPKHLVFAPGDLTFVKEMKLASESLRCPIEKRGFCIVALQLSTICKCLSFFLHRSIDVEAALCIYKSSKVGKIFLCGIYGVSHGCERLFYRVSHDAVIFFEVVHSFNNRIFEFFSRCFSKILKGLTFLGFFNKKLGNVRKLRESFFAESKVVRNAPVLCLGLDSSNRAVKSLGKPKDWFFSYRNHYKVAPPFLVSNLKASVSVYIASCVRKISFFHAFSMG